MPVNGSGALPDWRRVFGGKNRINSRMVKTENWKEQALAVYSKYLDALERDLPPESTIAEIEEAMVKHYRKMMSETMQILVNRQELSPPGGS
ncbi:MAG: hypothetical protein QW794_04085 [Thermosphaera sp.]